MMDLNWPLVVFTLKRRFREEIKLRKQWTRGQVMEKFDRLLEQVSMEAATADQNARYARERQDAVH